MATYRIAVLPGDGIGAEVTAEAVRVLGVVAKEGGLGLRVRGGAGRRRRHRRARHPAAGRDARALPGGATPSCSGRWAAPSGTTSRRSSAPSAGILRIRKELDLYANLRPADLLSHARGRLAAQAVGGRGHGPHGHPRAHGRPLLRRAARASRAPATAGARGQHHGVHVTGDRAGRAPRLRRRAQAPEAADLGGQGQRARGVAALAGGRHATSADGYPDVAARPRAGGQLRHGARRRAHAASTRS